MNHNFSEQAAVVAELLCTLGVLQRLGMKKERMKYPLFHNDFIHLIFQVLGKNLPL